MLKDFNTINSEVHEAAFEVINPLIICQMIYKIPIVERDVIKVSSFVVLDRMLDRKSKKSVESNDDDIY